MNNHITWKFMYVGNDIVCILALRDSNTGLGRSNMVVHSHAVILMLLSLFPESFGIF